MEYRVSNDNYPTLNPGDSLLFERGGVYRAPLFISADDITIGAYGEGPPPLFDGLTQVTDWVETVFSNTHAKIWRIIYPSPVHQTFAGDFLAVDDNGIKLCRQVPPICDYRDGDPNYPIVTPDRLSHGEYSYCSRCPESAAWTFYLRWDDGPPPPVYLVEKTQGELINTNGHNNLRIRDIALRGAAGIQHQGAIHINGSQFVGITDVDISLSRLAVSTSDNNDVDASFCTFSRSRFHHNLEGGVILRHHASYNRFYDVEIDHNYSLGEAIGDRVAIGITGQDDASNRYANVVEWCHIHHNGTYGPQALRDIASRDSVIGCYQTERMTINNNRFIGNQHGVFYFGKKSRTCQFTRNFCYANRAQDQALFSLKDGTELSITDNRLIANELEATVAAPYSAKHHRMIGVDSGAQGVVTGNLIMDNRLFSKTDYQALLLWDMSGSTIDHNDYINNKGWATGHNKTPQIYNDFPSWQGAGKDVAGYGG